MFQRAKLRYFRALVSEYGGNKSEAARRAGISRQHLYQVLEELKGGRDEGDPGSAPG